MRQGRTARKRSGLHAVPETKTRSLDPLFLQALLAARAGKWARCRTDVDAGARARGGRDPSLRWEIEDALANFTQAKNKQGKRISGIANPSAPSKTSARRSRTKSSGCPFLPMAMLSIGDYADFLIASQKPEEALQLLDIGRARTLGGRPGTGEAEARCAARAGSQRTSGCAQARQHHSLLFARAEKILVMGNHPSSHPPLPASRSVGYRNPGPELSKRHPEIDRPTARGKSGRKESLRDPRHAGRGNDSQGFQSPYHSGWRSERIELSRPCSLRPPMAPIIGSKM